MVSYTHYLQNEWHTYGLIGTTFKWHRTKYLVRTTLNSRI